MCRNIKTLFNFEPSASDAEIHEAARQFVRKLSGFHTPSRVNAAAFEQAVADIAAAARTLIANLSTTAEPRDRAIEAATAHALTPSLWRQTALNLQWALAGALTGLAWPVVARQHRAGLLLALERFEHGQA